MNYEVVKSARFRSLPTLTTNDTGASSVVGEKFASDIVQTDSNNPSVMMVKHTNGKWLLLESGGVVYTKELTAVTPAPADTHIEIDITDGVTTVNVNGVTYKA